MVNNESGQATTEYILILLITLSAFALVAGTVSKNNWSKKLTDPLRKEFQASYKYGDPKGKGYDEGEPANHPRISIPRTNNNFRIFYNPGPR